MATTQVLADVDNPTWNYEICFDEPHGIDPEAINALKVGRPACARLSEPFADGP
jgi:hypothetical protein